MSADLYLKTITLTEERKKAQALLDRVEYTMDAEFFNPFTEYYDEDGLIRSREDWNDFTGMTTERYWELFETLIGDDQLWISQYSALKASLSGEQDRWMPRAASKLFDMFDGDNTFQTITPSLVTQIMVAMNQPKLSHYERTPGMRGVKSRREVKRWLESHMGETLTIDTD